MAEPVRHPLRQPWLHELVTVLAAPTVALSEADGQIERGGAQGVVHSDVRVLSCARITVAGERPIGVGAGLVSATELRASAVARALPGPTPDPAVRIDRIRRIRPGVMSETLHVTAHDRAVSTVLVLAVATDFATVEDIKSGHRTALVPFALPDRGELDQDGGLTADGSGAHVRIRGHQARHVLHSDGSAQLEWPVELQAGESLSLSWELHAEVEATVVQPASTEFWNGVEVSAADSRWAPWVQRSLADLRALTLTRPEQPRDVFLAAGSPWFFTLFGRDSLIAARLMLPLGTELAAGTLRTLAALQGTKVDPVSAEQPGKIPHELRATATEHDGVSGSATSMYLPPLYYGTVDATPLWICLLYDAWKWGMPEAEVADLIPSLQAALGWLECHADPDGDGFLEYLDESGRGLSNQGWKDSGDSVRFADGRIAQGPVALCEVQGYAHEAARHGAELLAAFGQDGSEHWLAWADALRTRFRERFWVFDGRRRYPALALDGEKKAVDSLTSNIAHLLGTGILDPDESAAIAALLVSPELNSGFGLRTMSSDAGGYFPLSYHCGSVWAHDTALAVRGLSLEGFGEQAATLMDGLLAAAERFDYRLPELYSGDDRSRHPRPAAYPAACRPQAWAAAAVGAGIVARLGLRLAADGSGPQLHPTSEEGAFAVRGIRFAGRELSVVIDELGHATIG
ncbi:hypothetical protein M6D93_07945 [Jatrophihabitans telluris]|uniref:Amylo-alpha-1,6-glucosidase n=1 Tax=Jatrophihabitans telluris TaxID=2038343 RepID=A0ABY4R4G2_9ACTN|nr:glycogen debranching N-terminal domain-containing protein [Jatrophihabitans telluris]UQX89926.1 hypothetical protein M6D93_07945 [Jatrophihabitans telluris]